MSENPGISVIIPTCNRPERLSLALDSLVAQSFQNFEVVVVNDGEQDVRPVIETFSQFLRLTLVEHPIKYSGPSTARNTGIKTAQGDYISYLDDDDTILPNHLKLLYYTAQDLGSAVVYSDAVHVFQSLVDEHYQTVFKTIALASFDFHLETLSLGNLTPVHTVLHQAACLRRISGFAPYLRGHEDWDLWQRMARHHPFFHLRVPSVNYLHREGAFSLTAQKQTMAESWLFVRRQGLLYSGMPPVFELEKRAAEARRIGASPSPCAVDIIFGAGDASAFLGNPAASSALEELCASLARQRMPVRLTLTASGEAAPQLHEHTAALFARKGGMAGNCSCLWTPEDPGRILSANAAALCSQGEQLLFLEPFMAPANDSWLDALFLAVEHAPDAGLVGGLCFDSRGRPLYGGKSSSHGDLLFLQTMPATSSPCLPVDCLPSFCLMIRRDLFSAMEGFNPAYAPAYYADADLCLRLREKGYGAVVAPGACFFWNKANEPLIQSPAGLLSRRLFWDTWVDKPFPLERLTTGSVWPMRPQGSASLWPSEGKMPRSFQVPLPQQYRD